MPFTTFDERCMKKALKLAARGEGWVSPNPMVGAVVVRDGEIVGQGFHRRYRGPHAEVEALKQAGDKAGGASLYVTLEPCNHHGLTPPCTQAVLAAGIGRVVVAVKDPNPKVAGGGADFLRRKGVQVEVGLLESEARRLNEAWFKWVTTGLPFVVAKAACSLDGRTATAAGESQWITGEASRAYGHRLRHAADAILVGIGTVLADDPQLTVRLGGGQKPAGGAGLAQAGKPVPPPSFFSPQPPPPTAYGGSTAFQPVTNMEDQPRANDGKHSHFESSASVAQASRLCTTENRKPKTENRTSDPIRIVLDSRLRIPLTARLLHLDSPAPTWIATTPQAPPEKVTALQALGAEVLVMPAEEGRVSLKFLLQFLGDRQVQSLLVEGGPEVLGAFFDQRLVDKFYFFYAPKILGGRDDYPAVAGRGAARLQDVSKASDLAIRRLGPDFLVSGYLG
ncbi:MAG: bifunctional diaminohydroxyphosphoribosylaminopyrimidine deaminase/5-amino-6-(5-phosphoribosylamino)uracil reductase RibD [Deltaproteobacteria bacterium]|nr:bifunctional diaminohydroxyphosphoribosylaminopyrimidine deaminase/5-amino-6-(5-phosphoribosylamino)uracil reductase RibD [Deltaproteobacteria bacterium]